MSRYEGYENITPRSLSVRIGTKRANSTNMEGGHSHSYSSSGAGPMVFPSPSLIGEERERHTLVLQSHAHQSNFQSQLSASAPTPPQANSITTTSTSTSTTRTGNNTAAYTQNQLNAGGGLGLGLGLGLGQSHPHGPAHGQGLAAVHNHHHISFHHSHFRSSLADPIQSNHTIHSNIQIPNIINPNSAFYSSSFYDNLNTPADRSGSPGSASSVPADQSSSVHQHQQYHQQQLPHPVMGFAVPGAGQMQSLPSSLALNGPGAAGGGSVGGGGSGSGSAVGGGSSSGGQQYGLGLGHGHGHGHGQNVGHQNGIETPTNINNRLLNNPSRRASIQHSNNNHLLNLNHRDHHHHHQQQSPSALGSQPTSPQSFSPVGSFFNTNNSSNNTALYSSFHSPFEGDIVSQQYTSSTQSSSQSSPQSYSHAPQSPLSYPSSNSNNSSHSNLTLNSATPPSKSSSSLRCTLWWGDLEPWMDEEYAKQVCNLMGWENVAVKVPHSAPDHVTGQQANNPGYCFLTFPSPQHAASVLAQVNNPPGGQPLIMPNSSKPFTLNWASSPSPGTSTSPVPFNPIPVQSSALLLPSSNTQQQQQQQSQQKEFSIFVGDLAPETSNSDLVAVFRNPVLGLRNDRAPKFIRPFLSCKSAKIMLDPATGVSRGYGFVRYVKSGLVRTL